MRLRLGTELSYEFQVATPMIVMLNVHPSLGPSLEYPDTLATTPVVNVSAYADMFGNQCCRLVAPAGPFTLGTRTIIWDDGLPDPVDYDAVQHPIENLPDDVLMFLLPSRYCESDQLADEAWRLFGTTPPGWERVQTVCNFVNRHLTFNYQLASPFRTAAGAYRDGVGVCRDFAHLAVAFCRALNVPTRYCTGYISDVGEPPPYATMDLAAWMEVYLGGRWHVFDPRNNKRRIGRILIARGRDAGDVPLTHTFGPNVLTRFTVVTEEISPVES
ncbi:MAG TPA: transglutaminase family protein [Kaistia sp.]|nr:transglutaminase family protein [Kaistia sp.]